MKNYSLDKVKTYNLNLLSTQDYSYIYVYLSKVYKIFKSNYEFLKTLMEKANCLNAYKKHFSRKIMIPDIIYHNSDGLDMAYRYRYAKGNNLSTYQIIDSKSIENLRELYLKAYELVKEFHKLDIILSDINFSNFIVNRNKVYMIDFDEILIEEFRKGGISWNLFVFLSDIVIDFRDFERTQDWDNLSFLIEVFHHIVGPDFLLFDNAERFKTYRKYVPYLDSLCSVLKSVYNSRTWDNIPTFDEIVKRKSLIMTR